MQWPRLFADDLVEVLTGVVGKDRPLYRGGRHELGSPGALGEFREKGAAIPERRAERLRKGEHEVPVRHWGVHVIPGRNLHAAVRGGGARRSRGAPQAGAKSQGLFFGRAPPQEHAGRAPARSLRPPLYRKAPECHRIPADSPGMRILRHRGHRKNAGTHRPVRKDFSVNLSTIDCRQCGIVRESGFSRTHTP